MPQGRISKRSVDALVCPLGKDRELLWDDDLSGFGVAAHASGKKVYVAQYRQNGRSRRMTIGSHGRLTPDQARSEAKKLLGRVESGADPIEAKRAARAVRTFNMVADDFLKLHVGTKRKPRTLAYYRDVLDRHIRPAIGAKRMTDISRADLARLQFAMADTAATANRALAIISSVWSWAADHGEAERHDNPAVGLERYPEEGRERFLNSAELGRLGDALSRAETVGLPYTIDDAQPGARHAPKPENRIRRLDPFAVAAIRLLILTGARLREVLHAEWRHVDFERGIIHLADSKTGKKPLYLSAAALAILADLPRIAGNPHVIAGARTGKPRADLQRPWAAVIEAADLPGLRLHDLRHSFASIGAGASLGLPIIGKLLGHSQPATTARYAHLDADPMRRAVDTIGATITAAMGGQAAPPVASRHSRRRTQQK